MCRYAIEIAESGSSFIKIYDPAMQGFPSIQVIADEVDSEIAAQERRSDALESKAGVLLGFAGVLVALTGPKVELPFGVVGLAVAALAAVLAGLALVPRSFPVIAVETLRSTYLTAEAEVTRLRMLDTKISMRRTTERVLRLKARLVIASASTLALAIILLFVDTLV